MTDEAKKGSHLQIVWLCGLAACLSIACYGRPDSHAAPRAHYAAAAPEFVERASPVASGPTPEDLAVYVDLHQTRDVSRAAPRAHLCRD
jgi:hypothetical protein